MTLPTLFPAPHRHLLTAALAVILGLTGSATGTQSEEGKGAHIADFDHAALRDEVAKSLVVLQYVWDGEADRRELQALAIVIDDTGLVMAPADIMPSMLPDSQLKDFKLLIPRTDGDPIEVPATLQGRDDRSSVVFVRADSREDATTQSTTQATAEDVTWTPVEFVAEEVAVGQPLVSVGRLGEDGGYTPYIFSSRVATPLRGPLPTVAVDGNLTGPGSVVLNAEGKVVGVVEQMGRSNPFLTGNDALSLLSESRNLFVPSGFFQPSLDNPPTPDSPVEIPFLGAERLTGLTQDLREYYELGDRPAVQVGDIVSDSPAAEAEINPGDVIVAVNGEPLERGDMPDELPEIFNRNLMQFETGEAITLTLLDASRESREVTATLEPRPKTPREAERWYAEDLGFSVRELVFADRYLRKLPLDEPGVAVAFVREQGNAAAAGVQNGDLIRQLNAQPVEGLEQFREEYEAYREENPDEPVVLEVLRGSETQILRIEAPR